MTSTLNLLYFDYCIHINYRIIFFSCGSKSITAREKKNCYYLCKPSFITFLFSTHIAIGICIGGNLITFWYNDDTHAHKRNRSSQCHSIPPTGNIYIHILNYHKNYACENEKLYFRLDSVVILLLMVIE